ncbi:hypothetical protein REPUB_Repub15cG0066500 [Reevesia pubescens]
MMAETEAAPSKTKQVSPKMIGKGNREYVVVNGETVTMAISEENISARAVIGKYSMNKTELLSPSKSPKKLKSWRRKTKEPWVHLSPQDNTKVYVLKHKYFPHSSFIDAKVGNNSSLTWRSLCEARGVLNLGLRWRIGNGDQARILEDPWIPRPWKFNPILLQNPIPEQARHFFTNDDAGKILKIPLLCPDSTDLPIWHWTQNGLFTVKSGYIAQMEFLSQLSDGTSSGLSSSNLVSKGGGFAGLWKILWNLNVPNKVKVFGWRVCNNILPTLDTPKKRKIIMSDLCQLCSEFPESILHVLRDCHFATKVLKVSFGQFSSIWSQSSSPKD